MTRTTRKTPKSSLVAELEELLKRWSKEIDACHDMFDLDAAGAISGCKHNLSTVLARHKGRNGK